MKPDQDRVRVLLADTITLLCKNGLTFEKELKIQGLIGITLDNDDVFIVHVDEKFGSGPSGSPSNHAPVPRSNNTSLHGATTCRRRLDEKSTNNAHNVLSNRNKSSIRNRSQVTGQQLQSSEKSFEDSSQIYVKTEPINLNPDVTEDFVEMLDDSDSSLTDQLKRKDNMSHVNTNNTIQQSYTSNSASKLDVHADNTDCDWGALVKRDDESWFSSSSPLLAASNDSMWYNTQSTSSQQPTRGAIRKHFKSRQPNVQQQTSSWWNASCTGRRPRNSQEKNWVCEYVDCGKAFYHKEHLVRHQRLKHGKPFGKNNQTTYYCQSANCHRVFYSSTFLQKHMRDAHGIDDLS